MSGHCLHNSVLLEGPEFATSIVSMTRLSPLFVTALVICGACGESTATQWQTVDSSAAMVPVLARHDTTDSGVSPEAEDRLLRRHLSRAIAGDPRLRDRDLSFVVRRGDLRVIGTVGSEAERRRINDLAMSIAGVRSVANAVRVLP